MDSTNTCFEMDANPEYSSSDEGKEFINTVVNTYIETSDSINVLIRGLASAEPDADDEATRNLNLSCNLVLLLYTQSIELIESAPEKWVRLIGQKAYDTYCSELHIRHKNVASFIANTINKSIKPTAEEKLGD